ncbi:hypothetical protein ABW21_db0207732 [Orbilia brochopaga]|nr:hypothetical protein ABW21_db0207732 [Drechslerella brochopaga]
MKLSIALLASCLLPLTNALTVRYFIQITGQKQGNILKSTTNGFTSASPARGINLTIETPTDIASGHATGKRHYSPITVSRDIDDQSPLVIQALVTNENIKTIKVTVQQLQNTGTNLVTTVRTYTFTDAQIVKVDHSSGITDPTETLTFTFRKWELTSTKGGITVQDDWSSGVSA